MSIWLVFLLLLQPVRDLIWWVQNVDLTAAFYPVLQKVRDSFDVPTMSISCYRLLTRPTVILLHTCVMLFWLFRLLATPMKGMWSHLIPWMMTLTLPCSWRSCRMYVNLVWCNFSCWSDAIIEVAYINHSHCNFFVWHGVSEYLASTLETSNYDFMILDTVLWEMFCQLCWKFKPSPAGRGLGASALVF